MPDETSESNGAVEQTSSEEHLERIKAKRGVVGKAQSLVDERSEALKEAKAALTISQNALLAEIDDDQQGLLFGGDDPSTVAIEMLNLSQGVKGKLAEAGITTIGEVATHTKTKLLTDIEGIGEQTAEKIADALAKFWEDLPEESRVSCSTEEEAA